MSHNEHHTVDNSLAGKVRSETDVSAPRCYQCGKCSAGCPMAVEMDLTPSMVLRKLQTGNIQDEDDILRSMSIWYCLNCETCIARCPQEVDIPVMMDYLRSLSIKEGKVNPKAKKILAFHKSFLDSIKLTGKLSEIVLVADYKLRTLALTQDLNNMPGMIAKGKLHFIPERVKGIKAIKNIFKNTIDKKEKQK
ncbi:MAG: 4Fe-4S dicluster domain-containing protein [Bacteroidota bacterium]